MIGAVRPSRTLLFAAFDGEELGLFGSCFYVKSQPLYPLAKTRVMISVDMVGLGPGTGLDLYGATDADKGWIARVMANSSDAKGLRHAVRPVEPLMASDHACFAEDAGVPAVMALSTGMSDHPTYHTPRDTAASLSRPALEASLDLMWAFLVPVATGTERAYDLPVTGPTSVSAGAAAAPASHPLLREW